ncbi:uncharacterized protein VTP21DRAFT_4083 [Calcarisporiella thermophila]|uniref:uncharacterized protein n=1 Tax=Calcarisporiella thermophila TaxID=911321 RepID=UPI003743C839
MMKTLILLALFTTSVIAAPPTTVNTRGRSATTSSPTASINTRGSNSMSTVTSTPSIPIDRSKKAPSTTATQAIPRNNNTVENVDAPQFYYPAVPMTFNYEQELGYSCAERGWDSKSKAKEEMNILIEITASNRPSASCREGSPFCPQATCSKGIVVWDGKWGLVNYQDIPYTEDPVGKMVLSLNLPKSDSPWLKFWLPDSGTGFDILTHYKTAEQKAVYKRILMADGLLPSNMSEFNNPNAFVRLHGWAVNLAAILACPDSDVKCYRENVVKLNKLPRTDTCKGKTYCFDFPGCNYDRNNFPQIKPPRSLEDFFPPGEFRQDAQLSNFYKFYSWEDKSCPNYKPPNTIAWDKFIVNALASGLDLFTSALKGDIGGALKTILNMQLLDDKTPAQLLGIGGLGVDNLIDKSQSYFQAHKDANISNEVRRIITKKWRGEYDLIKAQAGDGWFGGKYTPIDH